MRVLGGWLRKILAMHSGLWHFQRAFVSGSEVEAFFFLNRPPQEAFLVCIWKSCYLKTWWKDNYPAPPIVSALLAGREAASGLMLESLCASRVRLRDMQGMYRALQPHFSGNIAQVEYARK